MKKENGDFWVKKLIQEEVFYSPEKALALTQERVNKKHKKYYHTDNCQDTSIFKQKYAERITYKDLPKIFKDKVLRIPYSIPVALHKKIIKAVKTEYYTSYISTDKRIHRKYITKLEQAIYFCLAVLHFNKFKNDEIKMLKYKSKDGKISAKQLYNVKYLYDVKFGCELSKEILTKIISNKDLYEVKNLLIRHNILGNVPLYTNSIQEGFLFDEFLTNSVKTELKNISFYSKELNEALRYFINPKYLSYNDEQTVLNKYADKHRILFRTSIIISEIN